MIVTKVKHEWTEQLLPFMNQPEYIVLHHSESKAGDAKTIHEQSLDEGGMGIGYHYVVLNGFRDYQNYRVATQDCKYGEVETGRDEKYEGAHASGFNDCSIGVCIIGDYDRVHPHHEVWDNAVELVADIAHRCGIPVKHIIGHRETYEIIGQEMAKSCPGYRFDLIKFRRAVQLKLADKASPHIAPSAEEGILPENPTETRQEPDNSHWIWRAIEWVFKM